MNTPANPYHGQMRLVMQVLPFIAREHCFALKGGTAINLFYRDLPRYSVDIDLTYLPGETYAEARRGMDAALRRIARDLSSGSPSYEVTFGRGEAGGTVDTLTVRGVDARIKIEVNPVLRGTVYPVQTLRTLPAAAKAFGFAEAKVLSFEDVYGGKLVAALDRQHPRDLFDVRLLLAAEGLPDRLFKAFLVYLVGHKGSIPNVLDPFGKKVDFEALYAGEFDKMAVEPVPLQVLLDTRAQLVREVHSRLDAGLRRFLLSLQNAEPEWNLLGVEGAQDLPAVKWRLLNLRKMSPEARATEARRLEAVLEKNAR